MKQVHILFADVGSHADDVTLLADYVDQLELLEQRSERVEALVGFEAGFDRDGQGRRIVEGETEEGVRDRSLHPVGNVEIDARQMRQRYLAGFVTHVEVVAGAIVEVADVADPDTI